MKMVPAEERILEAVKWGSAIAVLTEEIFKASLRENINLDKAFDNRKGGQKAFNDDLRVAIGVCERKIVAGKAKIIYRTKSERLFRSSSSNRESDEYKRKEVLRSNFAHDLKLAAQVAAGLIDLKAHVEAGAERGTLVVSGREVAKEFGVAPVILKPKQARNLDDKGTTRMSFGDIVAYAANKRNASLRSRVGSRRAVLSLENQIAELIQNIKFRETPLGKNEKDALARLRSFISDILE